MTIPDHFPSADESGFTLIELVVAAAMMVVITGAAVTMLISSLHAQPNQTKRADQIGDARNAIEKMTADIRQGISVATGRTASTMTLNTYCDDSNGVGNPCQVVYSCAIETGKATYACTRTQDSKPAVTVARELDSANVFCYVPTEPDSMPLSTAEASKNGCGIPAAADAPIAFVGVTIEMPTPGDKSVTVVEDGAALHNADL